MKKIILVLILFGCAGISYSQFFIQQVPLEANSIRSYILNDGRFNYRQISPGGPGFEWPKGTQKYAVWVTGIIFTGIVNDSIKGGGCSYNGDYYPGKVVNGIALTNADFRIYRVSRGDNSNNPDYAMWYLMVPYGAPYDDVNNNNIFDPMIDIPGVKNAAQTLFVCLTDGFIEKHSGSFGYFNPLNSEIRLTAWSYSQPNYTDVQFLKYQIINKTSNVWNSLYFSFYCDPDIGDSYNDYIGCDTLRNLSYGYNASDSDGVYGIAPPAAGIMYLQGLIKKSVHDTLRMTSFTEIDDTQFGWCENPPDFDYEARRCLRGLKKDSTNWLDVTYSPKRKTKFIYYGDPETNTGWTEYKGSILNCNGDTAGQIYNVNVPGDRKYIMCCGADDINMMPGDTQIIYAAQLIAKGSSNKNSVTKLKQLAGFIRNFFNSGFIIDVKNISNELPSEFSLQQNYPNPFNSNTIIRFQIKDSRFVNLKLFDLSGREVRTLVNEKLNPGIYEVKFDAGELPSGVYLYRLEAENFTSTKKLILLK